MKLLPDDQTLSQTALLAGDFQAFMAWPSRVTDAIMPTLTCRYQITSDPSNLSLLQQMEKSQVKGKVWESKRVIGYTIKDPDDLLEFGEAIWNYGRTMGYDQHYEMLSHWLACVRLLPKHIRAENGGTYSPKEALPRRMQALTRLYLSGVKPCVIPANYATIKTKK